MNIKEQIDALVKLMPLKEKIGQLTQIETPIKENVEAVKSMVRRGEVGSILMSVGATAGNDKQGAIDVTFYNELQRIAIYHFCSEEMLYTVIAPCIRFR